MLNDIGVTVENARQELLVLFGQSPAKPKFHTSAWGNATASAAAENPVVPRYSDRVRLVLAAAYDVAKRQKSTELTMVHTAIALLEHGRGAANVALDKLDFQREDALSALTKLSARGTVAGESVDVLTLNSELSALLQSVDARNHARGAPPGTHHLLLGIMAAAPDVAEVFATQRVTVETFRDAVNRVSG
jgi:ATP-dependent Clp protease ATP-binding subunit ClpA